MVALLVVVAAACGSGSSTKAAGSTTAPAPASADTITIKNFAFSPNTLTVAPGATVTVHNSNTGEVATHTVTATGGAFNTGDIAPGQTKTFTAPTKPGSYPYICEIHQYMTGTLVVS